MRVADEPVVVGLPAGGFEDTFTRPVHGTTSRPTRGRKARPRVSGRDAEIRQVIDVLTRRRQNNPILTGEAGVGKTAVVEGLALRIVAGDVPEPLGGVELRTLDLGLLQAGAGVKGEFENRLKSVMQEVKASPVPIILFIDEAHTMIGAGGQAGQNDAANLLKPALARGELRTIAATTFDEYKKYFEGDPALEASGSRRFRVDEPDEARAVRMLRAVAGAMEKHHGVRILDEAVVEAVRLGIRYLPERHLPDKAVSLLDTARARVKLSQGVPADARRRCPRDRTPGNRNRRGRDVRTRAGATTNPASRSFVERAAGAGMRRGELTEQLEHGRESRGSSFAARSTNPKPAAGRRQGERWKSPDLRAELSRLQGESPLVLPVVDGTAISQIGAAAGPASQSARWSATRSTRCSLSSRSSPWRVVGQDHAPRRSRSRIQTARARPRDSATPGGRVPARRSGAASARPKPRWHSPTCSTAATATWWS